MNAVVDNDIILKGACYGILNDIISPFTHDGRVGVLGVARFVVSKRVRRISLNRSSQLALTALSEFLADAIALEPTIPEQRLAADLEFAAQRRGLAFDAGESQLCAIVVTRAVPFLLTGDKRAIAAAEELVNCEDSLIALCGRIMCLEQIVFASLDENNANTLRASVCAEPAIDITLTICFACGSSVVAMQDIQNGLNSYIEDLRNRSVRVLAE